MVRQTDRVFQLSILQHVAQDELQVRNIFPRRAVFPGRKPNRGFIAGVVEIVGFQTSGFEVRTRVHMKRDEQIGILGVGGGSAVFQRT